MSACRSPIPLPIIKLEVPIGERWLCLIGAEIRRKKGDCMAPGEYGFENIKVINARKLENKHMRHGFPCPWPLRCAA